ncbi:MAG: radical SAM protein [Candidatus Omnitrophota bacterium]
MIIDSTKAYCNACNDNHHAVIRRDGNRIYAETDCPRGKNVIQLSSDAEMFIGIRDKIAVLVPGGRRNISHTFANLIDITDECNFECPICVIGSGKRDNPRYLSIEEIYKRVGLLKTAGGRAITLMGGEPTLHPELIKIVRMIKKQGINVLMATNGMLLGTDRNMARNLKKAGLSKAMLQFDTFDKKVHLKLRGNEAVDIKIAAARNMADAKLGIGLIVTVTSLNIEEIGKIIEFGISLHPAVTSIIAQGASPEGRYLLPKDTLVDREQIIKSILDSGVLKGTSIGDIWPLPYFEPWGLYLHPDCAVNLIMMADRKKAVPIGHFFDTVKLYGLLAQNRMESTWFSRNLVPLYYLLRSVRVEGLCALLGSLSGVFPGISKKRAIIIGIGSYASASFRDQKKISRCATSQVTSAGLVSPCMYDSCDKRCAGSRKYNESAGIL